MHERAQVTIALPYLEQMIETIVRFDLESKKTPAQIANDIYMALLSRATLS